MVHLVWDERIILFDGASAKVLIYSLTQMDNTGLDKKVLQPLYSLSCSAVAAAALPQIEGFTFWGECHISAPIVRPEWVRFIIAEEDRIWGFNVPRDITVAPQPQKLSTRIIVVAGKRRNGLSAFAFSFTTINRCG